MYGSIFYNCYPDFLFSFFVLFHQGTKYNKKREPMRSLCIVPRRSKSRRRRVCNGRNVVWNPRSRGMESIPTELHENDWACKPGSVRFRAAIIYLHCGSLRSSSLAALPPCAYRRAAEVKDSRKVLLRIGFTARLCYHKRG